MNLLSIIDKLYENDNFATILIIAIVVLVILFVIVLILGIRDAKKSSEPKKIKEEDIKDITFEPENKERIEKEDVTFEKPVLTKNLEDFRKSFEEEIEKDQDVEVRTSKHSTLSESTKPVKILDINIIEDTAVMSPVRDIDDDTEEKIVTKDVLKKEIFKDKKEEAPTVVEEKKSVFKEEVTPKEDSHKEEKKVNKPNKEEITSKKKDDEVKIDDNRLHFVDEDDF